jgi:hypothetical protein
MSKTPEIKVAEQLVNLTESHWFNPAILGRYLADQPYYTVDRVMEMIVYIIKEQSRRHDTEVVDDLSSEGILLARELYECVRAYKEGREFKNLKLPKSVSHITKTQLPPQSYRINREYEEKEFDEINLIN